MARPENSAPDEWGSRGREYTARRAEAGTPKGKAYAARLKALPPAEAADEVRAMFALVASEDLAGEIANDLQLDPEKAERIAREIQAARQRLSTRHGRSARSPPRADPCAKGRARPGGIRPGAGIAVVVERHRNTRK